MSYFQGPSDAELKAAAAKLIVFGFDGLEMNDHARRMIRKGCGGVILFKRNVDSPEQVSRLCNSLKREAAPRPLLIMTDQEGGKVARLGPPFTALPAARTVAEAARPGDDDAAAAAAAVGKVVGRELRAVGIDMNLAPVVDVDTNPANPVIGSRAYSRDPETVSTMGAAYVSAVQSQGVAACAKHFPGHGDTAVDSHLELPSLPHGRHRLESVELPPFRAAIDADVAAVLVAHVAVPALSGGDDPRWAARTASGQASAAAAAAAGEKAAAAAAAGGVGAAAAPASRPATMSPGALAVLRDDLGFGGLVLSDDLEMGAITKHWGTAQAVVEGLHAGVDCFLVCHSEERQDAALAALIEAVRAGDLPWAKVLAAGRRYDRLASTFVRPATAVDAPGRITLIGCQEHRQLVADILRKGMPPR